MPVTGGIDTTGIRQPGTIAVPQVTRMLVSDLQLLDRHFYKGFVNKYRDQDYFTWFETFAGKELTTGRDFYHYESLGKLMLSFGAAAAVVAPAAGANVTVTLSADSHATVNGSNYSPIRVGENVRLASNDKEGKIIAINKTVANAHTATIRPLRVDVALSSAGSADLLANEVFKLVGTVDMGEASTNVDTQVPLQERINNSTSVMHDTFTATDLAEMEKIEYNFAADLPFGTEGIINAYTLRGMQNWTNRYKNNCSFKLMYGDVITNTGLPTSAVGTQGLIPSMTARSPTSTYTAGGMTLAAIQTAMRLQAVNGSDMQLQWLMDIYAKQDFDAALFGAYGGGAFVYGTGSASQEASVAYGFQDVRINGYNLQVKMYPFNTEIVYGRTPNIDKYRYFSILIPQGKVYQAKTGDYINNLTVMYQQPAPINSPDGSLMNGIRIWRSGGNSPNATNSTLYDAVDMVQYKGLRAAAMNQFAFFIGQ